MVLTASNTHQNLVAAEGHEYPVAPERATGHTAQWPPKSISVAPRALILTFLGMNGRRLTWSNDEAYEFIMDVSSGRLDDVSDIAKRIDLGSDER